MPPKRKNVGEEPTARDKKKQKIAAARTIAVQSVKSVSFSQIAVSGPSTKMDSKHNLLIRFIFRGLGLKLSFHSRPAQATERN